MKAITSLVALFLILGLIVAGGLIYLGQVSQAPTQHVEKVLPDDQFPR